MTVTNGKSSYETIKVYSCAYNRDRGKSVCTNTLRRPVDSVNQAVSEWISENVLSEDLVVEVIAAVRERLSARAKTTSSEAPKLEKDAERLRKEIDRLVGALASTDQKPDAVIRGIADRQEQLAALETRLRAAKTAPETVHVQLDRLEEEARKRIQDLRGLLERNPEEGREVIRAVFEEPLKVTPVETNDGKRYWIEGRASIRQMLTTDRGCLNSASPAGRVQLGTRNRRGWTRLATRRGWWRLGWWGETGVVGPRSRLQSSGKFGSTFGPPVNDFPANRTPRLESAWKRQRCRRRPVHPRAGSTHRRRLGTSAEVVPDRPVKITWTGQTIAAYRRIRRA